MPLGCGDFENRSVSSRRRLEVSMNRRAALAVLLGLLLSPLASRAALPESVATELAKAKYAYVASQRKDGSFSKPAEIWFLFHEGAVYVASPPTAWRVKRIRAGRKRAQIAVGKVDGPSFLAKGEIAKEPDVHAVLFETFAKKYPDGWGSFEKKFREGLKEGSRVLVKYVPE
jgi:hypothetical protein